MKSRRSTVLWIPFILCTFTASAANAAQAAPRAGVPTGRTVLTPVASHAPAASDPASAGKQRALLDQYCVSCHNDRTKTANLSLQNLDLTRVGDNPELWERVVRKLRAGVMPPPAMK